MKTTTTARVWRLIGVGILLASVVLPAGRATEPENLAVKKAELRAYVQTGDYERDVAAVAARAAAWLETRTKTGGKKLAVVFDLDETLLSNWPEMNREDLGFAREPFNAWMESAQCPPIEKVRDVYRTARRLGFAVIYITGRPERFRAATQRNLEAIGCADYAEFVCRPDDAKETSAAVKTAARAKLEAQGYTIVANLGDQESDLVGGHAEQTFKLPNPFYLTK